MSKVKKSRPRTTNPDKIGYWYEFQGINFYRFVEGKYGDWVYDTGVSDFFPTFSKAKADARELFNIYKQRSTESVTRINASRKGDSK